MIEQKHKQKTVKIAFKPLFNLENSSFDLQNTTEMTGKVLLHLNTIIQ